MPSFSVSELKQRATDRYTSTKDKWSSTSSSSAGYNPPRPGSHTAATSTSTPPPPPPPPPPPSRTRPHDNQHQYQHQKTHESDEATIDWVNLTDDDKQVFFSWLDEFFSRYTGRPISSFAPPSALAHSSASPSLRPSLSRRTTSDSFSSTQSVSPAPPPMPSRTPSAGRPPAPSTPPQMPARSASTASNAPPPVRRNLPPPAAAGGPPKINYTTRPTAASTPEPEPPRPSAAPGVDPTIALQMSYPPTPAGPSSGADLAAYIAPHITAWGPSDTWYASRSPVPPMPEGVPQGSVRWTAASSTLGTTKTLRVAVVFADLSACFVTLVFPTTAHDPSSSAVHREARYTLRPDALGAEALLRAHTAYGDAVARFAESYAGTGRYVARGECWDLAHEALKHVDGQVGAVAGAPVPSLSRTHGHLIYCGKPGEGRWRGGDACVRRGDVVEWRKVRIESRAGWAALGDPDHTAVIVEDCVPSWPVEDGSELPPAALGTLVVVEQSVGSPPKRSSYALENMTQGEVWVYRPVCMREYVGFGFEVDPPPGAPLIEV